MLVCLDSGPSCTKENSSAPTQVVGFLFVCLFDLVFVFLCCCYYCLFCLFESLVFFHFLDVRLELNE